MRTYLLLLFCVSVNTDHAPSEFVTELTGESYLELSAKNQTILTMFYAPWCGHCKKTMPIYETACKKLNEELSEKFTCARLDCTKSEEFCQTTGVKGYPTIRMTREDVSCEYKGPRTEEDIQKWTINFYQGLFDLGTVEEVRKRITGEHSIVAYLAQDSSLRGLSRSIGCDLSAINFAVISSESIANELGITRINTFNVFVNGTFLKTLSDINDSTSLLRQIFFATNPLLPEYSHDNVQSVFSNFVTFYVCFIYEKPESLEKHRAALESFAAEQVPRIRVFTVDGSNPAYKDVLDYFHVTDLPQVVFYNDHAQNYNHLEVKEDISVNALSGFADGCINGSVPIYLQRQPIPENWEKEDVKVLVTDTYEKIFEMYNSGIMLFFAPWCGHCEALMPTWTKLGAHIVDKYPSVFIAKIDHTQNYVPDIEIQGYPTIIAFKSKTDKVVYSGDRTFDDIEKFLLTHLLPDQLQEQPIVDEKKELGAKEEL